MKNKFMQTTAGTLFALLMLFGATQIFVSGQEKESDLAEPPSGNSSQSIEGAWQTIVTL